MYSARIIAHSVGPVGIPVVSILLRYPRMVHADFTRHRAFSYSVASSRAIPSEKLRQRIMQNPATIAWWGKNQRGMVAEEELKGEELVAVKAVWEKGMESALELATRLDSLGLHKQLANRVLEPWMDVEQLTTGTDWSNFEGLRCHKDAQPELQYIARMAMTEIRLSTPQYLQVGEWHLPFITQHELDHMAQIALDINPTRVTSLGQYDLFTRFSAARCARTSYLNHEGKVDYDKDLELFDKLVGNDPGHWSPLEHVCQAMGEVHWTEKLAIRFASMLIRDKERKAKMRKHGERFLLQSGNFVGWKQLRKFYEERENIGGPRP